MKINILIVYDLQRNRKDFEESFSRLSHSIAHAPITAKVGGNGDSADRRTRTICPNRGRTRLHGINRAIADRNLTLALEILERAGETGDRAIESLRTYQRMMGGGQDA